MSLLTASEEDSIIQGLRSGGIEHRRSAGKLYERLFGFLHFFASSYNLPDDDVKTAYSKTILNAINDVVTKKFRRDCSLETYVYGILKNRCIDVIRSPKSDRNVLKDDRLETIERKRNLIEELPEPARGVIEDIIARERLASLEQELIMGIGEKCKEILMLKQLDNLTDEQIAQIMEFKSADVAKTIRKRCYKKLELIKEKLTGSFRKYE